MMLDSANSESVMALIAAPAAWFLALLLGLAAVHKLLWRARGVAAVSGLTGMRSQSAGRALSAAAGLELLAATSLLIPAYRSGAALLAASLWGLYVAAMARALLGGRRAVDCGCSFGATHRPLGRFQLARTAVLVVVAFAVALQPAALVTGVGAVATPAIVATQALCACALLALYAALDSVMSLDALRPGVLR